MNQYSLSVREIQETDIELIVHYWLDSDDKFLVGMGVDLNKLPTQNELTEMLTDQMNKPIKERNSYCFIWLVDEIPVGHSNTNPTEFGDHAYMHLHLWDTEVGGKGLGQELVKLTLPYFFKNLKIKKLYSEPYALNAGANRTLENAGFELEKEYITTPGAICSEQKVKRWVLGKERFEAHK